MHELSIIKALVEAVDGYRSSEQKQKVKAISIEVGSMTCVDADRLLFCFDMIRDKSGLANAQLRIQPITAVAKCQTCGCEYTINRFGEPCQCGSYQHDMLSGSELNLTEIEFV